MSFRIEIHCDAKLVKEPGVCVCYNRMDLFPKVKISNRDVKEFRESRRKLRKKAIRKGWEYATETGWVCPACQTNGELTSKVLFEQGILER